MMFMILFFIFDVVATVWNVSRALDGNQLAMYCAAVTGACALVMLVMIVRDNS